MDTRTKETPAYLRGKRTLPPELHEAFDDFLSEYRFATLKHHGGPYVSAVVIAELVLAGWRRSAPPSAAIDTGIK